MGEYEPNDSRNVTLNPDTAPGEPPRTGPREGATRSPGKDGEHGEQGERAATPNQTPGQQAQGQQGQGQQSQSQSMGGMSQSQGGTAGSGATGSSGQGGSADPVTAPAQGGSASTGSASGSPGSGGKQAGYGSVEGPQQMQEGDEEAERTRREQAANQGEPAPKGMGYDEGDTAGDGGLDPDERGYGGGGEERMARIEKDR